MADENESINEAKKKIEELIKASPDPDPYSGYPPTISYKLLLEQFSTWQTISGNKIPLDTALLDLKQKVGYISNNGSGYDTGGPPWDSGLFFSLNIIFIMIIIIISIIMKCCVNEKFNSFCEIISILLH